jgi:hypothetical protein
MQRTGIVQQSKLARAIAAVGRTIAGQFAKNINHFGIETGNLFFGQTPFLGGLGRLIGKNRERQGADCQNLFHGLILRRVGCRSHRD